MNYSNKIKKTTILLYIAILATFAFQANNIIAFAASYIGNANQVKTTRGNAQGDIDSLVSSSSSTSGEIIAIKDNLTTMEVRADSNENAFLLQCDRFGSINSGGILSGGDFTHDGSGGVNYTTMEIAIKTSDSQTAPLVYLTVPAGNIPSASLTTDEVHYAYINYNNGNPQVLVTTDRSIIRTTDQIDVQRFYKNHLTIYIGTKGFQAYNFPRREHERTFARGVAERFSGAIIAEKATRYLTITESSWYGGTSFVTKAASDSQIDGFEHYYSYNANTLTWTDNVATYPNQIDNMKYNNTSTGTLADLNNNQYGVHWIYLGGSSKMSVVFGHASYKLNEATAVQPPSVLPSYLSKFAVLVGKVIVKKGESSFTLVNSAFEKAFVASVVEHNDTLHRDAADAHPATAVTYADNYSIGTSEVQGAIDHLMVHVDNILLTYWNAATTKAYVDGTDESIIISVNSKASQSEVDSIENSLLSLISSIASDYWTSATTKTYVDTTDEAILLQVNSKASQSEVDSIENALLSTIDSLLNNYWTAVTARAYINGTDEVIIADNDSQDVQIEANRVAITTKASQSEVDSIEASLLSTIDSLVNNYRTWALTKAYIDATDESIISSVASASSNVSSLLGWRTDLHSYGFVDQTAGTLSYDPSTCTFTITGTHEVYINGVKTTKTTASITHSAVTAAHYFYYDSNGVLTTAYSSPWGGQFINSAQIAYAYYNATKTTSPKGILFDERHGLMDTFTHLNLHLTRGASSSSLFPLGSYSLQPTVPSNGGNQFSITGGIIYDEDLSTTVPDYQDGPAPVIFWREGVDGHYVWDPSPTVPAIVGATYVAYNQLTGGSWTTTEVGANSYVNYYTAVTNSTDATYENIIFVGQQVYSSLATAQAESPINGMSFGTGVPFNEIIITNKLTYRTSNGYVGATGRFRIEAVESLAGITIRLGNAVSSTSHPGLAGRSDPDQHPASSISVDTSAFSRYLTEAEDTVQKALAKIDQVMGSGGSVDITKIYADNDSTGCATGEITIKGDGNIRVDRTGQTFEVKLINTVEQGITKVYGNDDASGSGTGEITIAGTREISIARTGNSLEVEYTPINAVKSTCLYYGYPIAINDYWEVNKAAAFYASFDIVVFGDQYQQTSHETHVDTVNIIAAIKNLNPKTEIFGYVPAGGELGRNLTTAEIHTAVDEWAATGATGIFFDEFGYDYKTSRQRQNDCISYARGLGLNSIANSWSIDYVFNGDDGYCDWIDYYGNPGYEVAVIGANDYYLFENMFYYYDGSQKVMDQWRVYEAYRYYYDSSLESTYLENYYDTFKTKTIALDAISVGYASREKAYMQGLLGSRALNIDAYACSIPNWGADTTIYPTYSASFFPSEAKIFTNNSKIQPLVSDYSGETYAQYNSTIENNLITFVWDPGATPTNPALGTHRVSLNSVERQNANTPSASSSSNIANNLVKRDSSGNFTAGTITASLSGNASTATKLATARNINGVPFDGSADITLPVPESGITKIYGGVDDHTGSNTGEVSILAGSNVTVTRSGNTIEVSATGSGAATVEAIVNQIYASREQGSAEVGYYRVFKFNIETSQIIAETVQINQNGIIKFATLDYVASSWSDGGVNKYQITTTYDVDETSTVAISCYLTDQVFDGPNYAITKIYGGIDDHTGSGTGEISIMPGANISITRTGNTVEITSTGGSADNALTKIYGGSDDHTGSGTGEISIMGGTNVTVTRSGNTVEIAVTSSGGGKADEATATYVSANTFDFPTTYDTSAVIICRNGIIQPRRLLRTSTVSSKTRVEFLTTVDGSDEIMLYSAK